MPAASTYSSAQHVVENMVRGKGVLNTALTSVPVKSIEGHVTGSVSGPNIGTTQQAASVNVTVTGAGLGDTVVATPVSALPTNCILTNAFVSAANTVTLTFHGIGTVTGAANTFNLLVFKMS